MPSAMVDPPWGKAACLTALYMLGKRRVWTPITRMPGLERLGRRRNAADQAAAADRHHQGVQLRHGLQHLQATVPWPAMIASSS